MNIASENFSINKKNNAFPRIFIGAVLLLLFIFVLNILNSPIKNLFFKITSPVEKTFWTAGESSAGFFSSVINFTELSKQNDNLKNENQKLISEVTSLQAITDANQAQTNVSAACQNTNFKLLMAGVTGLEGKDILSINKGSADGLAVGMPVISQQSVIYGRISKVYKNYSEVMLISNKQSVINVRVQQSAPLLTAASADNFGDLNEADGVAKGSGGLSVFLDLVAVNNTLNSGDVLVTSSLEKTFPKDLLVGTISKIVRNDQKPFQQASIQPFFDLNNADNLFVITNYKQPN